MAGRATPADQAVPGAGQGPTPARICEQSMEPFECEHKTPVSQGSGEGAGKEARLVATPLGCQSVAEAGQAATVRWHRLGQRDEQRGFGCGGNDALWWPQPAHLSPGLCSRSWPLGLHSSACSLWPQAVLEFKSCPSYSSGASSSCLWDVVPGWPCLCSGLSRGFAHPVPHACCRDHCF